MDSPSRLSSQIKQRHLQGEFSSGWAKSPPIPAMKTRGAAKPVDSLATGAGGLGPINIAPDSFQPSNRPTAVRRQASDPPLPFDRPTRLSDPPTRTPPPAIPSEVSSLLQSSPSSPAQLEQTSSRRHHSQDQHSVPFALDGDEAKYQGNASRGRETLKGLAGTGAASAMLEGQPSPLEHRPTKRPVTSPPPHVASVPPEPNAAGDLPMSRFARLRMRRRAGVTNVTAESSPEPPPHRSSIKALPPGGLVRVGVAGSPSGHESPIRSRREVPTSVPCRIKGMALPMADGDESRVLMPSTSPRHSPDVVPWGWGGGTRQTDQSPTLRQSTAFSPSPPPPPQSPRALTTVVSGRKPWRPGGPLGQTIASPRQSPKSRSPLMRSAPPLLVTSPGRVLSGVTPKATVRLSASLASSRSESDGGEMF